LWAETEQYEYDASNGTIQADWWAAETVALPPEAQAIPAMEMPDDGGTEETVPQEELEIVMVSGSIGLQLPQGQQLNASKQVLMGLRNALAASLDDVEPYMIISLDLQAQRRRLQQGSAATASTSLLVVYTIQMPPGTPAPDMDSISDGNELENNINTELSRVGASTIEVTSQASTIVSYVLVPGDSNSNAQLVKREPTDDTSAPTYVVPETSTEEEEGEGFPAFIHIVIAVVLAVLVVMAMALCRVAETWSANKELWKRLHGRDNGEDVEPGKHAVATDPVAVTPAHEVVAYGRVVGVAPSLVGATGPPKESASDDLAWKNSDSNVNDDRDHISLFLFGPDGEDGPIQVGDPSKGAVDGPPAARTRSAPAPASSPSERGEVAATRSEPAPVTKKPTKKLAVPEKDARSRSRSSNRSDNSGTSNRSGNSATNKRNSNRNNNNYNSNKSGKAGRASRTSRASSNSVIESE